MRVVSAVMLCAATILVGPGAVTAAGSAPATATTGAVVESAVPARTTGPPGPRVYERRVVRHTNRQRRAHDRRTLKRSSCLNRYAQRAANRIAANGRLVHQDLKPVLRACGGWKVGENIAYGYRWPRHVVRAWMDSPGHRANILERRYRRIGVGVRRDSRGVVWVSQVFAYRR
ncbi:CAP domain-containing protein [Mumia zhuanghuii]|uniref:CAP domain-containing protein n=1 Tax=Mumia zhuanghuii TaxID=2585211 RepID=A0A5C4M465_9ACTN|nr:CAP domain-containing protein [Mumia zhuanghuii]TNC26218.1 CAP domain-containing protein [Mumia zhuanghuii]